MQENIYKIADKGTKGEHDSIVYRSLVLIMLLTGLMVVSQVDEMGVMFIILASFGIIAGSVYSYLTIKNNNKWLNILFSLSMFAILFLCKCCTFNLTYFTNLKLLALHIIVFLQVLYSFFGLERKNLKLTTYISLVLVSLCVSINFTANWAFLLICFMLVVILVYFYDDILSRGYILNEIKDIFKDYDHLQLTKIILSILLLSFLLFACMPRLHLIPNKYFLITDFVENNQNLVNEIKKEFGAGKNNSEGQNGGKGEFGYSKNSSGGQNGGKGEFGYSKNSSGGKKGLTGEPYKKFDEKILTGTKDPEEDLTNKGLRGSESRLLFKVKTPELQYIREIAFDKYTGKSWKMTNPGSVELLYPSSDSEFYLPKSNDYLDCQYRMLPQYYKIEKLTSNLIVSTYRPALLYYPSKTIAIDTNETLLSSIIMGTGFEYAAVVAIKDIDINKIISQNAIKETVIKQKYQKKLSIYLNVPASVTERTKKLAQEITSNAKNDYDKALKIKKYLLSKYTFTDKINNFPEDADAVDYFLFVSRKGQSEDFSSSLAIMLRLVNVPTRFVSGYLPEVINPFTGYYDVRSNNSVSWVEAYIPNYGWVAFYKVDIKPQINVFLLDLIKYLLYLFFLIPFVDLITKLILTVIALFIKYRNYVLVALLFGAILGYIIVILLSKLLKKKQYENETILYLKLCRRLKNYGFDKSSNETAIMFLNRVKFNKHNKIPHNKYQKIKENIDKIEGATKLYLDIRFGKVKNKMSDLNNEIAALLEVI